MPGGTDLGHRRRPGPRQARAAPVTPILLGFGRGTPGFHPEGCAGFNSRSSELKPAQPWELKPAAGIRTSTGTDADAVPSHPTHMKDGFVLKQPEAVTEAMAPVPESSSKRQVSVGMTTEVLDVRAELADTPPRAPPSQRSKRQVSPGLNTPQAPAAKREMVEDSEEEEEDGTDADIRRWMEAEHMETESTEKGAEAKVQEGLEGEFSDGYDEEEADRAQTRQRGCLMESEGIQREEGARARRGQLFTVESSTMGG